MDLINDFIPDMIESITDLNETEIQDRLATKKVHFKIKTLTFNGLLAIMIIMMSIVLLRNLLNRIDLSLLKYMIKDSALMLSFVFIILVINNILSSSSKQKLNIYGVLYYVDIDKLLMQIVTFILTWFGLGILFTFLHVHQSNVYDEYEHQDPEQLHRIFENMYLDNDLNMDIILEKVQYHSIRQQFIHPIDIPLINQRVLRNDFNFAYYLKQNSRKIYSQLLRINSFSIIPILIGMYLTYVVSAIIITIFLIIIYFIQKHNLYQIYTQITTPYQYNPCQLKGIQTPPYINLPMQKRKSKIQQIIGFKYFNLRLLHSLIFIQIFWFSWLFYAHRIQKSILEHTWLAIFVSISSINITILIPLIIKIITFTHNLININKCTQEQQYLNQELLYKVSHYLRFLNRKEDQIENENEEKQQYSLTVGQQQLIKYAFTCLINNEQEKYIKQALEQYKKQILADPTLLQIQQNQESNDDLDDIQENSQLENDDDDQESIQQPQQQQEQQQVVGQRDIKEALKEYESRLVEKLLTKTEESSININQLQDLKKYIDCNLPLWYIILMIEKYFKLENILNNTIKYNDLCNYSGYNQYVIETDDGYQQNQPVIQLIELKQYLMQFFSEEESQKITKEYSYQVQMVEMDKFYQFIENNIVLFPK